MVPIKVNLDPDDHYDGTNIVKYIVIHDTGNPNDSDEGNAVFFCGGTRKSSAHYFVDDDSITQLVLDKDGAWHCGDGHGIYGITNRNSLGVEMCRQNGTVTLQTENNTIDLVKMLMQKYNVPASRVVRHYDASRKNCPSAFSANNWARWYAFKSKLSAGTWLKRNDGKWLFYENGQSVKNAWRKDTVDWCYLGADGAMVTNSWQRDSSKKWFYCGADGHIVHNSWQQDGTKQWCYLGADGAWDNVYHANKGGN